MKKFLSLVLALAMTMSLVTVSAGAKDFTDASKINYDEAVAVVSAAKIVDGYEDGSFNPGNTLTRGAAAKIICNMILGPTAAAALSADSAPYSDVPTNHTFAGYIAYCAQQGIISGYADGTFRPAGTLTGYAFMKMLLGALGYDATIEGYVGNNWSIAVAKQALNIGLDDGNDNFAGQKAVTREEACLYAFNTLKATMVDYDSKTTVNVNGAEVVVGNQKAYEVARSGKDYTGATESSGKYDSCGTQQFCEKYFDKLTADKTATDDFGRPATEWKYDKDKVGTYADDADNVIVLDKAKTAKTVLTDGDYMNYDTKDVSTDVVLRVNAAETTGRAAAYAANLQVGDVVEAFENSDGVVETVVVSRYVAAKIDSVDEDLSSTYTSKGASCGLTLTKVDTLSSIPSDTYYDAYKNNDDKVIKGFDADTYTEDTVLAVAFDENGVILDSYVAEHVTATVSSYKANEYVNAAGTKYKFVTEKYDGVTDGFDKDTEYDIYTTEAGYALAIVGTTSGDISDVYYVTGVYGAAGTWGGTDYFAQAISLKDGSVKQIKLENNDAVTDDELTGISSNTFSDAKAGLYKMTDKQVKGDRNVTLCKSANGKFNAYAYTGDNKYAVSTGTTLADDVKSDSASITLAGTTTGTKTKLYFTNKTNCIAAEDVKGDLSVKTAVGAMSCAKGDPTKVYVVYDKNNRDAAYVVYAGKNLGTAVGSDDVVYVNGTQDFDINTSADTTAANLWFMKDVASNDVTLDGTGYGTSDGGFHLYSTNSDGNVELKDYDRQIGVNIESGASDKVDSNTTGCAQIVIGDGVTDSYNKNNKVVSVGKFDDVSYADAKVLDTRTSSDRANDVYDSVIRSISNLESALDKNGNKVTLDVFVKDGDIIFIAVVGMTGTANGGSDDSTTASEVLAKYVKDLAKTYRYENANVTGKAVRGAVNAEYSEDAYAYENTTVDVTAESVFTNDYVAPLAGGEKTVAMNVTLSVTVDHKTATDTITVDVTVSNTGN